MSDNAGRLDQLAERMAAMAAETGLKIPPPVFAEMKGEVVAADEAAATLVIRFPVQERYQNPLGFMQGGIIAAAVDNTIGPLSYLVAPPSVTRTLTMTYRRPVRPSEAFITVTARLVAREGTSLSFEADVRDGRDRLLARAEAHNSIVRQRQRANR